MKSEKIKIKSKPWVLSLTSETDKKLMVAEQLKAEKSVKENSFILDQEIKSRLLPLFFKPYYALGHFIFTRLGFS